MKSEKKELAKCEELSKQLIEELEKKGFPNPDFKQYCYQDDEGVFLLVKIAVH